MAAPTITSIDPINGEAGQAIITVEGTSLDTVFSVQFPGESDDPVEAEFDIISDTELSVLAPYNGAVTGNITVINSEGSATSASTFTFDVTTEGDYLISTAGDSAIILITTDDQNADYFIRTTPESGIILISTESGNADYKIRTTGERGLYKIKTVSEDIVYIGEVSITFDPILKTVVIKDVTTWGSGGKPTRPTSLYLDFINLNTGKIITLTPNDVPASVTEWTSLALTDAVYQVTLRDDSNNIYRSATYVVNELGSSVQNEMEVFIAEQMKCNKHDYSDTEYWTMRALNESVVEAAEVGFANEAQIILADAINFAKECSLKHKYIKSC